MRKSNHSHLFLLLSFLSLLFVFSSCFKSDEEYSNEDGRIDSNRTLDGESNAAGGFYNNNSTNNSTGEHYNDLEENAFISVAETPVSTFSVDADGASYSNVRRFLNDGELPPASAIRTEELINYFPFQYDQPETMHPIALNGEISACPWNAEHRLLRIGIQGKDIPEAELPATNYVFLIDVSGSMNRDDKLPLLKESFKRFAEELNEEDRISIVTYSGAVGVALAATPGNQTSTIQNALESLQAGGSTAGGAAIVMAYDLAQENFIEGGNNRIILATDGDFNVGLSSQEEMIELIEEKRELGIFLTVIGAGTGNLKDGLLEQVANNGNGTYEYIDNLEQGDKIFIHDFKKFHTVAKDVKVQIEFNSAYVKEYRLIGYENRSLSQEDFVDDAVDAAEIGCNQSITALYELIPTENNSFTSPAISIDFRYKLPESNTSIPLTLDLLNQAIPFALASEHQRFAAAVAAYGMLLRDSDFSGTATYDQVNEWAGEAMNFDPHQYRSSFLDLVEIANGL